MLVKGGIFEGIWFIATLSFSMMFKNYLFHRDNIWSLHGIAMAISPPPPSTPPPVHVHLFATLGCYCTYLSLGQTAGTVQPRTYPLPPPRFPTRETCT